MNKSASTYRKSFILTAFGLMFGICQLYAQDGQYPGNSEQEPRPASSSPEERVEGGMQVWDNGSGANETVSGAKATNREAGNVSQPVRDPEKTSEKVGDKKGGDDSVLSFNFLYYLIQKFKLSETVE